MKFRSEETALKRPKIQTSQFYFILITQVIYSYKRMGCRSATSYDNQANYFLFALAFFFIFPFYMTTLLKLGTNVYGRSLQGYITFEDSNTFYALRSYTLHLSRFITKLKIYHSLKVSSVFLLAGFVFSRL